MLTKMHFEAAAELIQELRQKGTREIELEAFAGALVRWFKSENPRFSEDRFLRACEPKLLNTPRAAARKVRPTTAQLMYRVGVSLADGGGK